MARCFWGKGCALEKDVQIEKALETFEEASRRFPDCGETTVYVTHNAAIMLERLGRLDEAIAQNERAIEFLKRFPKEEMTKGAESVERFRKTLADKKAAAEKAAAEKAAAEKAAVEKAAAEKAAAEKAAAEKAEAEKAAAEKAAAEQIAAT